MTPFGVVSFGSASIAFLALTLLLAVGRDRRTEGAGLVAACAATALWAAYLAAQASAGPFPTLTLVAVEVLRVAAWLVMLLQVAPTARRRGTGVRDDVGWLMAALALAFGYDLIVFGATAWTDVPASARDARGLVNLATVPMIAAAARRNRHWSPRFYVSRQAVHFGAAVAAGGAWLLCTFVLARLASRVDPPWGDFAPGLVLVASVIAAIALVAWPNQRQRLRVFISKHFYRSKYDYRGEWLRFIDTLSAPDVDPDPRDRAIHAIAQIIGSPGAVLFQRLRSGKTFSPTCAWPRGHFEGTQCSEIPAGDPMIEFLERRQWVIDLKELQADPAMYGDIPVPAGCTDKGRTRVILPLLHGADLIGFVALDDPPTAFEPNFEDRDLLKTVGRHVATHLVQHEADQRLAESREFEAFHRLTAFVMHDLKNLAAQLALIVANAERHRHNPDFVDDVITTVANSASRMQRLIDQLHGREAQGPTRTVPLAELASRACKRCSLREPTPALTVADAALAVEADPEQLVTVLEHLVRNAQDAAGGQGAVAVTVRADGDDCVVAVDDDGCGMTEEFVRERLFRPFDSTKGAQGMGIGAYQLREYVGSLGGSVTVTSAPGRGTTFVVRLPRSRA